MPSVGVSLRDVNPIPLALKSVLILNDIWVFQDLDFSRSVF
ncbi:hypothetical protein LINPERPRIM_LOCUS1985 [Linum perenne]